MKPLLVVPVFTGGEVAHEWIKSSCPTGRLLTDFWPKKASFYNTRRAHFAVLYSCPLTWGQKGSGWSCSFTMVPRKKGHVDLSGPCWAKIQLLHRLRDENTHFHMNFHWHPQPIHLSSVTSRHPTLLWVGSTKAGNFSILSLLTLQLLGWSLAQSRHLINTH